MIDLRDATLPVEAVIAELGLAPHPEGGHYRETWRDIPADGARGAATAILFLLAAGQNSRWHRVDAAELWLWQAGAPLALDMSDGNASQTRILGPDNKAGQALQGVVPAHRWQAATSQGGWTLVSCIVAPAFDFAGFEMATWGWQPADRT